MGTPVAAPAATRASVRRETVSCSRKRAASASNSAGDGAKPFRRLQRVELAWRRRALGDRGWGSLQATRPARTRGCVRIPARSMRTTPRIAAKCGLRHAEIRSLQEAQAGQNLLDACVRERPDPFAQVCLLDGIDLRHDDDALLGQLPSSLTRGCTRASCTRATSARTSNAASPMVASSRRRLCWDRARDVALFITVRVLPVSLRPPLRHRPPRRRRR